MRAIWLFLSGASLSLAARPMWADGLARDNAPVVPDEMISIYRRARALGEEREPWLDEILNQAVAASRKKE